MHFYSHHISDFNQSTRHCSRLERSIYRDLIEFYYDKEKPLPLDLNLLCRKIIANSDEEISAVKTILSEFFTETEDGYVNQRCQKEIDKYQASIKNKSEAGRKSAEARIRKRKEADAQQTSNRRSTSVDNHKPFTNNDKPSLFSTQKFESEDYKLAMYIDEKLLELNGKRKEPNFKVWAADINKMVRLDKRSREEIKQVFDWANADEFWSSNILSPAKLRKQFDTLLVKMGSVKKKESKLKLPANDDELWDFAKKHGLSNPSHAEDYRSYRYRLAMELEALNARQG
jgi:uncharacterized protein YdaU (DUF1376 family)